MEFCGRIFASSMSLVLWQVLSIALPRVRLSLIWTQLQVNHRAFVQSSLKRDAPSRRLPVVSQGSIEARRVQVEAKRRVHAECDTETILPFDCSDVAPIGLWTRGLMDGMYSVALKGRFASSSHLVHHSSVLVRRRGCNLVSLSRVVIGGVSFWPIGVYIEGPTTSLPLSTPAHGSAAGLRASGRSDDNGTPITEALYNCLTVIRLEAEALGFLVAEML
ncbi:hypothetical protein C8Q74DRAFT_1441009, partial [Fomes fomentarius]